MYRIREYCHCCGAGGGYSPEYEDISLQAARDRIKEARQVGAEYMVTSCSHCKAQFEKASAGLGSESINVLDIVDLVFRASAVD